MATAIIDCDIFNIPARLCGYEKYSRALVLARFNGIPVAQTYVTIRGGTLSGQAIHDELFAVADRTIWEELARHCLFPEEPSHGPQSVTVAICTRDRTDDLRKCLDSVRNTGADVIVVDNSPSSDATQRLVREYPGVRYVREDRPGLNCARNRALRETCSEIVAFIDDDAVADPRWLNSLLRNFEEPLIACATGLTMPSELETPAQEWFEQHCPFGRGFRRRIFRSDSHNPHATGAIGAGVNMALRREIVLRLGGFDEALDAGTATKSGGDHEMFSRLLISGYAIAYDPHALNWHRHRRTWKELKQTMHGYGVGVYASLTRSVFIEHEWPAIKIAIGWFRYNQFPALVHAIQRKLDCKPLDLVLAELRGCLAGPRAYLLARKNCTRCQ